MPLAKLPQPQSFPAIAMDAMILPIMGWQHGDRVYAFTTRRDADGKYQALVLNEATGKPEHSWPFDGVVDAQSAAAQDYGEALAGVKPAVLAGEMRPNNATIVEPRVASVVASLRGRLPAGWHLNNPELFDGGWRLGIHSDADPIAGTDVWDPNLDVALRKIGEAIDGLRATERPN